MRLSTKRILGLTLSIVFIIGLIIILTSFIKPEFAAINQKRSELFSKSRLYDSQKNALDQVQQLIDESQNFSQLKGVVSMAMPVGANTTDILNQINAIAQLSQVEITQLGNTNLPFGKNKNSIIKRVGKVEIKLEAVGGYENIKNLVNFLESNVRIFDVQSFQIGPANQKQAGAIEETEPKFKVGLTMITYYQEP